MKKEAISFTPFDNRDRNGMPSIGPATQRSIVPTNNVHTMQDVLNGHPYKMPGTRGHWAPGEDAQPGSFKSTGDDYKRQEIDMEIIKEMTKGVPFASGIYPIRKEVWKVKVPGGSKEFLSFNLAEEYKEKLRDKGILNTYVTRVAQLNNKFKIIEESLEKTFMIESINISEGVKETGSAFCVAPNYFITCAHVIKNYNKNSGDNVFLDIDDILINVYHSGIVKKAKVVDVDIKLDIAMLLCDINIAPFELGDPIIGQDVISVGSPHGYENNISRGTIGSLDRKVYNYDGAPYYMFADMSIFPGNSGGPVIDEQNGKVVGMVTLIVSGYGGFGLNACLPSKYIRKFCSRILAI